MHLVVFNRVETTARAHGDQKVEISYTYESLSVYETSEGSCNIEPTIQEIIQLKTIVFWDIAQCSSEQSGRRFGGANYLTSN
jgi:hypothetical protein